MTRRYIGRINGAEAVYVEIVGRDEWWPVPITKRAARALLAEAGDDLIVETVHREGRYTAWISRGE
jgi:hypothetical protein